MILNRRRLSAAAITAVICLLLSPLESAPVETNFTATLSTVEQSSGGLMKLSAAQVAALDAQIAREIAVARQGDAVAFARSFIQRRTPLQAADAGLDLLTSDEHARLDGLVARAVSRRPVIIVKTLAAKAREQEAALETITYKPQIHGEVTFAVGMASGGRNFYGGSFTAIYDDPQRKFSVAFTYAEYHGKGLLPYDDGFHDGIGPYLR